jgi:DNA-binding response OmpR family regulator
MRNGRARVLVLDEDTRLIERVVALLQARHEVIISGRRYGRVSFLREIAPDLVLLGVRSPFPGGDEVLRAVRAAPPLGVPVLMLSGADPAYLDALVRETGAAGFVRKAELEQTLQRRVEALLAPDTLATA